MRFLPAARPWRHAFLVALVVFLGTRALTLMAFPIFNDEAIYLQYSQLIHEDWAKNKFVSMDNQYGDWKPPLQYWMAAPGIRWRGDPLLAGRAIALLVSTLGIFGFYLFAREFFGEREGVISAALFALCPPVLFHNNQFIAETFLFSTAPFVYWSLLKAMQPNKWRWVWAMVALALAAALLLFKQSGILLLGVAFFLPCARLRREADDGMPLQWGVREWNWKAFALNLLLVAAVVIGAHLVVGTILPAEFQATRERFNGNWVMSPREVLSLPKRIWSANLSLVGDYIGAYYSWLVLVFVGVFLWFAVRRKSLPELTLAAMAAAGAFAVIFLLRGFNEYLFNTAVIAVLLPLLARTVVLIWNLARTGPSRLVRRGLLGAAALLLGFWSYQIILIAVSPAKYIEQSTPWALRNYLQSWPTGFGVKEVVAMLEKQKGPGIIFADAQWGNPRTALEVYGKERFPNLRIVPVLREFSDRAQTRKLVERAKRSGLTRFAIFSADSSGRRREWQSVVESEMCENRMEWKADPRQMPIVVCEF